MIPPITKLIWAPEYSLLSDGMQQYVYRAVCGGCVVVPAGLN